MTKTELIDRVADLEALLEAAVDKASDNSAVVTALGDPHIASSDKGSPVAISFRDGYCGVLIYEHGATLFVETETVGAVGDIPAEVLMEELNWARR